MNCIYADDSRFMKDSDSEIIQAAVDYAVESGVREVVIPRVNPRTGEEVWNIEKAILLPSDILVIIDNAHLRMADGVFDNMFRNKIVHTEEEHYIENEQHDIRIKGLGSATIDGGKLNGLCEQSHRDEPGKHPPMTVNLLVFFSNVRNFEISGIHFVNSRWWALCFFYCRMGHLHNLCFSNHGTMENQDGIDLRVGCNQIIIENITGITGDDTIALTAIPLTYTQKCREVKGKDWDIHDVIIRNVISSSHGCGIVRLLCEDGAKVYSVIAENILDTARSINGASFIIGDRSDFFAREKGVQMGDMKDITIRNVRTCAHKGISLAGPCENMLIENFSIFGKCNTGILFHENFKASNVTIRNFVYDPYPDYADCLFKCKCGADAFEDMKAVTFRSKSLNYVFRGSQFPVEDFRYEEPKEGFATEDFGKPISSYGRYFRYFCGEEITCRPKDNRFDGTIEEDDI